MFNLPRYTDFIGSDFVTDFELISQATSSNLPIYWLMNKSNTKVGPPTDLAKWIIDPRTKKFADLNSFLMYGVNNKEKLPAHLIELFNKYKINTVGAVTLLLTEYGIDPNNKKRILFGTSSLNQKIGEGQVHAELITTGTIIDKFLDVSTRNLIATVVENDNANLANVEILIVVRESKNGNLTSMEPCEACKKTIPPFVKKLGVTPKVLGNIGNMKF
jgi:hypothetical protein